MPALSGFWLDKAGVLDAVRQASVDPLDRAAALVERRAKLSMKAGGDAGADSKSRNAYWNSDLRPPRWVVASDVGSPPHRETGNLVSSIQTARTPTGGRIVGPTRVGWYGRVHEFGTLGFKRPFMRPALDAEISNMPKLFRNLPLSRTRAGQRLNARKGPPG